MIAPGRNGSIFAPVLHGAVFASVGVGNLYLLARLFGQVFDDSYQLLAFAVFVVLFTFFGRYSMVWQWKVGRSGSIGTRVLVSWLVLAASLVFIGFLTRQTQDLQRRVILLWLVSTPLWFMVAHLGVRRLFLTFFPSSLRSRSTLIVFLNPASHRLAQMFANLDTPQFRLVGFIEDRNGERAMPPPSGMEIVSDTQNLANYVNQHRIEVVFVVLPLEGASRAMRVVEQLGNTTASVYYVPDSNLFQLDYMRFSEVGGIPVFTLTETPFFGADGLLKRLMDIAFSSAILITIAPFCLLVALAVRIKMGSPIIFTQKRYGLDGREINVHKFRTMTVAEDGDVVVQASRDDKRITPLGAFLRRTSIDEWPQFWNVLKGDMSLVGPRPHAVAHNEQYRSLVDRYMVRHKVKPGLTGLAQVNGLRGETRELDAMKRRVEHDLKYIRDWSPGLDLSILLRTAWIVFRDRSAY
ncbi:undecaprenyl-phosphate glucose phosphotransferase [Salinisphaera sp. T31B1]|uniref:undecaprenyl-phosphate glucose phosphotransferase n=1 Tax=Salinisphaera sp. T31B1 TaxID=727963 RepID=UPI00333F6CF4